ncbi:hypothetical protein [Azospirillum sp. Sh1]|uniref:hypothetical protein n=1 Tax=Azospirillum sp. Sh1 TaxID=2607285 RepID=UPI0011EE4B1D|nr:hypothetical protein [Azospirillum sp. Sh1]KAA0573418.1 hypothetical protein FZ029_20790 [Azospirillum sp. Sh1]
MKITNQERDTILAALRFYQSKGMGDPFNRPDDIHDIATNGGDGISLDDAGIDALCERLNVEQEGPDPIGALIEEFGGDRGVWGEHPGYPRADWRYQVENGDTNLGYWEWVENELAIERSAPVAEGGEA